MTQNQFPIIDIAPFLAGDRGGRGRHVAEAIRSACEDIGFFIIIGHGVPDELIMRLYNISRDFFDLPNEQKARVGKTGDLLGGLMYFPIMAENLAASIGQKTPADFKESLDYGPGFYGDRWPSEPAGLQAVWLAYYETMGDLAAHLGRIFALAIGLPETYFVPMFDSHHSSLRVLNYPEQEEAPLPGQLRAGAHSDYGFLTILRSEASAGGLQAQHRNGEWIDVPAIDDAYVVNIGDAMMRWTNDRWQSTLHRVVNSPADARAGSRRQSIPFFHNPNKDAVIECLDAFSGPESPARYPPIAYGEYAELKYRQAHGEEM